jgi:CBS domain-containing protein
MKTIGEVTIRPVPVVEPQTTLDEVVRLMEAEPLRTVALVGDEMYMGIFNDDALNADLIPRGADYTLLTVGPYVQSSRVIAERHEAAETVLAQMVRRNQAVAPVLDNRIFVGVVTRGDLEAAL